MPARAPEIDGLEIATGYRPAREISGDLFDFLEHNDQHTVLAFGDVSGKGAAAALYGALVSGLLRTLAPAPPQPRRADARPQRSADRAQGGGPLRHPAADALAPRTRREFTLANAGAIPPMICRGGEIVKLRAEGVPSGLLDSREYEE